MPVPLLVIFISCLCTRIIFFGSEGFMNKNVLVIAAHPDDEILGSGGTIKKLINLGYKVISVIAAKGRKEEEDRIRPLMLEANRHLGVEEVLFLEFPNLLLETIPLHEIN